MNESAIIKLWQGDYSLPVTYWLFGVVGLTAVSYLSSLFAQGGYEMALFGAVGHIAYIVLVYKGIWASACKRGGFWAGAARVYVGIGTAFYILTFAFYLVYR